MWRERETKNIQFEMKTLRFYFIKKKILNLNFVFRDMPFWCHLCHIPLMTFLLDHFKIRRERERNEKTNPNVV